MNQSVLFVFSNPGHHTATFGPVAGELAGRGVTTRALSLCSLRGLPEPEGAFPSSTLVEPLLKTAIRRRGSGAGSSIVPLRPLARALAWCFGLAPKLAGHLADRPVLVVPNDVAYPYDRLLAVAARQGIRWVLCQEGIRFPLPAEKGSRYGTSGAAALAAWGEASAEHFRNVGAAPDTIRVTGCPRFDLPRPETIQPDPDGPLLLLTNPVDAQGFCSEKEKHALVADFLARLPDRFDAQPLLLRVHPGESPASILSRVAPDLRHRVALAPDRALEEILPQVSGAIILATSVGLEALRYGVPVGVLPLPGYGWVHDYVDRGAAIGLDLGRPLGSQLDDLRRPTPERAEAAAAYVRYHLADDGSSSELIADLILDTLKQ